MSTTKSMQYMTNADGSVDDGLFFNQDKKCCTFVMSIFLEFASCALLISLVECKIHVVILLAEYIEREISLVQKT